MHNFNSISVSLCLLFKCTERKQHPCRNLADNMRHRLLSSARFLFFLSTHHSSSHRTIFKWHNFGKTAMYMSCVLCIKTGERDKTFFLPRRLRLLLHSFLTLKKYLLSNRTLKAPCCPKEHETFVYSNLFNCFQFVFSNPPSPFTEHKTFPLSNAFELDSDIEAAAAVDVVGNATTTTTVVREFIRVQKTEIYFFC